MNLPTPEQLKELGFRLNPTNGCWMRDFPEQRTGDTISQGYLQLVDHPDEAGWTVEIHNGSRHLDTGEESLESVCLPQRVLGIGQLVQLTQAVFDPPWSPPEGNSTPLSPLERALLINRTNEEKRARMAALTIGRLEGLFEAMTERARQHERIADSRGRQIEAASFALRELRKTFDVVTKYSRSTPTDDDRTHKTSDHLLDMIEKTSISLLLMIGVISGYPDTREQVAAAPAPPPEPNASA